MIAFGCAMTDPEAYHRYARPGIERTAEPDSAVFAIAATGASGRSANLVLDAAAARDDLEALVLVDQEVEIDDPGFCAKVREGLRDADVLGCAGATGVQTIAWWEGEISAAPIVHRYDEHGGGELPGFAWTTPARPPVDVDMVSGMLMVLSPWAVKTVRFDEALLLGHGYDLDYCRRVRAEGRTVRTADLRVIHHHALELIEDGDLWAEAHVRFAERTEPEDGDWKARARRAEAECEAARTIAYSAESAMNAQVEPLERQLEEMTDTRAWRATAPLRWANGWVRERRSRA